MTWINILRLPPTGRQVKIGKDRMLIARDTGNSTAEAVISTTK
jgi:hypothetical protein